jgi:hypothetical protein
VSVWRGDNGLVDSSRPLLVHERSVSVVSMEPTAIGVEPVGSNNAHINKQSCRSSYQSCARHRRGDRASTWCRWLRGCCRGPRRGSVCAGRRAYRVVRGARARDRRGRHGRERRGYRSGSGRRSARGSDGHYELCRHPSGQPAVPDVGRRLGCGGKRPSAGRVPG